MNANSQQQTLAIKDWLFNAKTQLSDAGILSALLDSEIILAYALKKGRTYLHSNSDEIIDINTFNFANNLLTKRLNRMPIAYLIGYKEFYGRNFIVTPATLIPRPESEDIIDILKRLIESPIPHFKTPNPNLIDVGTGSGCLGISAKLELPNLKVTLIDIDDEALKIAEKNKEALFADVKIFKNDLLSNYSERADIIIANLPYVDIEWERSPETQYEPGLALFASNGGLSIIKKLINQASKLLNYNGYLIIEADPTQHNLLTQCATEHSFEIVAVNNYVVAYKLIDYFVGTVKNK